MYIVHKVFVHVIQDLCVYTFMNSYNVYEISVYILLGSLTMYMRSLCISYTKYSYLYIRSLCILFTR